MLGCISSGSRPAPLDGVDGGRRGLERIRGERGERGEEPGQAEQHGGRVGGDLPQAAARQEQRQGRPQRRERHPQQQRALLRGPRRRQLVEDRDRRGGRVGDDLEAEVIAQERELEHDKGDDAQRRQRVDRTASGIGPFAATGSHSVERRADPVQADSEVEQQNGAPELRHQLLTTAGPAGIPAVFLIAPEAAWYLDGHFVVSEFS